MIKKKLLWALPLVALAMTTSCKNKVADETQAVERIKVKVATAQTEAIQQEATFTATVEGEVVNHITPAMPMRIKKIYVDVGSKVAKGQRLVEMDNSSLEQQRVQLENLERDYKRYQGLLEVGGVSQQQVDQMKVQLDMAKTAIANVRENTILVSPISGTITARNYDNGDVFAQLPILTVQQLNPVKALINVSESYFPKVHQGMPVKVMLDIYGEELFQGKVTLIYPTIDPNTHTFTCEVSINNSDMRVRPGMFARVTLNFGSEEHVVVPDLAVIKQSGSNDRFVYVVSDGKVTSSKVAVGQRINEKWEVISGVKSGDEVVTAGHTRLVDGAEVQVVEE